MVLLIVGGFHVPVIPFGEVVFNVGTVSPLQKVSVVGKSGVMLLLMVTFNVVGVAHCPASGVNT
ncbi:hypothetical protein H9W95_09830 [Flavobacterium lindanitolerans]|nr:hypothetical protein [Flavobacterium lindanitolerans]